MERISALMDGELDGSETTRALDGMKDHPELAHAWSTYHAIGDAMRRERVGATDFASRVAARLADEPTILAPRRAWKGTVTRLGLPALAAAAAVATVTWMVAGTQPQTAVPATVAQTPSAQPAVATAPPSATPAVAVAPMLVSLEPGIPYDRSVMTQYIMAHQEYSPNTLMQGVVSYMRTMASGSSGPDR